jgi:hypothetical protein
MLQSNARNGDAALHHRLVMVYCKRHSPMPWHASSTCAWLLLLCCCARSLSSPPPLCRRDVDPALRRALLDEALETQEQDNEELLTKFRQRLDR